MTGITATRPRPIFRMAFTLVELLVVVAIIGVLVGLLLPAMQSARESGRRTQCANQLRQLGVAANSYVADMKTFPGGMKQWNVNASVTFRGIPLFVELLPNLEYKSLLSNWHFDNPLLNCSQGRSRIQPRSFPRSSAPPTGSRLTRSRIRLTAGSTR